MFVYQQAVWPHSGHYKPTAENFEDFVSFLKEKNVDLEKVEVLRTSLVLYFFEMKLHNSSS